MFEPAPLPEHPHRLVLALTPRVDLGYANDREPLVRAAFERLAERLGTEVRQSSGAVGFCSMDGLTGYFDVHGAGAMAWSYVGLDYGHMLQVELLAETASALQALHVELCAAFSATFRLEKTQEKMPLRATR